MIWARSVFLVMHLLELKRVFSGYRADAPVVRGVDLTLAAGDFLGLLGPNGCGKSTLIRTITHVVPVMAGMVTLEGREIGQLSRKQLARLVGVVPQDAAGEFSFTVREIVTMGRHPYLGRFRGPGKEDEEIVEEAMALTRTSSLAQRSIGELSGGERQRVIVARALAQKPRLLLLDEPTNHLDINHQVEIFDLLHQLNQEQGVTLLCVTHDLNFAAEYCNRITLMDKGRIVASGSPDEVLTGELIGSVYGVEVRVEPGPRIVPLSRKTRLRLPLQKGSGS